MAKEIGPIPRIAQATGDVRSLPLGPVDGFLLSRIDGKLSAPELAALTGLSDDQVRGSLDKLKQLGVIDFGATVPTPSPQIAPPRPSREMNAATPPLPASVTPPHQGFTVPDDTPELLEAVELALNMKKRILGTHAKLGELNHYELLGVERTAEKKTIKRAYFEIAALFHPDKYFRKELGTFKLKMETIFGRVTQGYEVLTSKDGRKEYDQYLQDLDRTRGLDTMLKEALAEMQRAESEALAGDGRPSIAPVVSEANTATQSTNPTASNLPPTAASSMTPPSAAHAVTARARRDALAMRLMGGRGPRNPSSITMKKVDGGDALKRRYEERSVQARRQQGDKLTKAGADHEAKNDVVAAADAYEAALTFIPDDPALKKRAEDMRAKADAALHETYLRQASYEERSENWQEAAKSWGRLARLRPNDARAHERAAQALVRSNGDLHLAAQLASRAIAIEPANAGYKVTLANVYLSAGLMLNAKRELEAALQLSPGDDTIKTLLKRAHKAG